MMVGAVAESVNDHVSLSRIHRPMLDIVVRVISGYGPAAMRLYSDRCDQQFDSDSQTARIKHCYTCLRLTSD